MIKVLIVDDHELVRSGIKSLLMHAKGITVVAEAQCGEEAIELARREPIDVVLMDMIMPGIGGIETTRQVMHFAPTIKVIALTARSSDPFPLRMLQAGAVGYLTKGCSNEELIQAIRTVYAGQRYLKSEIAQHLAFRQFDTHLTTSFDSLSEREWQVMLMVTKGESIRTIAEKLHLSDKTINTYRYRLYEKLNVKNDVELTHLAMRYGLFNDEEQSNGGSD